MSLLKFLLCFLGLLRWKQVEIWIFRVQKLRLSILESLKIIEKLSSKWQ
jgi:hypothetical protein